MAKAETQTKRTKTSRTAHKCSKCGRVGHNIVTCTFKRRVGAPRPLPAAEQKAIGLTVENTTEVNAELNNKTCACPTCGTTFTGQQVFDAIREQNTE